MANIGESGYEDNSLILYNKTNGGYITISDFFTRATDGYINDFGVGKIETIKAKNKTLSVDYDYINKVREQVASYLSTGESVADVLSNQSTSAETIENLITCFTKQS